MTNNNLLFFLLPVLFLIPANVLAASNSTNGTTITSIPPNMHQCLNFVVTLHLGFLEGYLAGTYNGSVIGDEVKAIEGCILHPEKAGLK